MNHGRAQWIDCAKAIGIILVVYGHVARGLLNSDIPMPSEPFLILDSVIYSFHMPLFFFLSGLLFTQSFSKSGFREFILNKLGTVFYPYIVWSILQGSIEVVLSGHSDRSVTFDQVLSLLWLPRAQFWFLYALFFIFCFAGLVQLLTSGRHLLLTFCISVALYLIPAPLSNFTIPNLIAGHFVFFFFGVVFTRHLKIQYFSGTGKLLLTAAAFVAGQWMFHQQLGMQFSDRGPILLVLTVVSILFVVTISVHLAAIDTAILTRIGAGSLAIYLMHILAGSGTRMMLAAVLGVQSYWIHLLVGCFAGIYAPLLALKLITTWRIPFAFSIPIHKWITKPTSLTPKREKH